MWASSKPGHVTELRIASDCRQLKLEFVGITTMSRTQIRCEPRLSGNSWRLFADPAQLAVINVAYLDGARGPQFTQREGWDVLGVEFRVVEDFGAGVSDWRGSYLNPGQGG